MRPQLPPDDFADARGLHAELGGEGSFRAAAAGVLFADCPDISLGQKGKSVVLSDRMPPPALSFHIAHVVELRAKEQVRRLAARAVVTLVANVHAVWNRAVGKEVREARRVPVCLGELERSVSSARMSRAGPLSTASHRMRRANPRMKFDFVHFDHGNRRMDSLQAPICPITAGYSH